LIELSVCSLSKLALHSVPRSGSSWLGEILNSHPDVCYRFQPLFSYAYKSALSQVSDCEQVRNFFTDIADSDDDFILLKNDREAGIKPVFEKNSTASLIAYKEVRYHYILENALKRVPELKLVGLIRCPLAVLYSFLRSPREFRLDLGWDFESEWRFAQSKNLDLNENYFGYEKWKEVAFMFLRLKELYPDRTHLVNYNELISDSYIQTKALFRFLKLPLHNQTKVFLGQNERSCSTKVTLSDAEDIYSVYNNRIEDDGWRGKLPNAIVEYIIDDLKGTPLTEFLSVPCQ
jgi:hypothetical protein